MKIKNLHDLFVQELRDTYHAEKQLVKALPKMAKAATSDDLRTAFEDHLEETKNHVTRIEDVFGEIDQKATAKTCEAMKGLVTEGSEMIEETEEEARDAGLIAAAQKVEHYEIASYGCLVTWAKELGHENAANLLQETLDEEKAADEKLNSLALQSSNAEAR
jgi:ferritin-like metal-binding protein YciE